jgi:hypothetical protein
MSTPTKALIAALVLAPSIGVMAQQPQAPQQQQIVAAQQFADDLVHGVSAKKLTAQVAWNKQWTCEISIGGTDLRLTATGADPKRNCVLALLQVQRMGLI